MTTTFDFTTFFVQGCTSFYNLAGYYIPNYSQMMDGEVITKLRTAAASAVAVKVTDTCSDVVVYVSYVAHVR